MEVVYQNKRFEVIRISPERILTLRPVHSIVTGDWIDVPENEVTPALKFTGITEERKEFTAEHAATAGDGIHNEKTEPGYRCPNCFMFFGMDMEALYDHFNTNPICRFEASKKLVEIGLSVDGIKENETIR